MTKTANDNIIIGELSDKLDQQFTQYAFMSLEDRALPDARDGLKPSQRRILVAMDDLKLTPGGNTKKCAKICGDTSGNYHPHGEAVIYPTLVRLAQSWVMRYPLVSPQGNFGNRDGDPPAAMRYTEAKLAKSGHLLLQDLNKDVVDYQPNYNEEMEEPTILPAKAPNLLLNGCAGIAVGWATNMPPHNLTETCSAIKAYIDNENLTAEEVLDIMPGPDFPNGCKVLGRSGVLDYYKNGRGSVKLEGVWEVKNAKGRKKKSEIIITELPYMASPTKFIDQVVDLIKKGEIDGISDMKDLSSKKDGLRIWIEIKQAAVAEIVLNTLIKRTCLRDSFSINSTVLIDGKVVECASIIQLFKAFVEHRELVLTRKFEAERRKNIARTEIVEGLIAVTKRLDDAIKIIRNAEDPTDAKEKLIAASIIKTENQAEAVLSMTLRSLTKLEAGKLKEELEKLVERKKWLDTIIGNKKKTRAIIVEELDELIEKFGDDRRSQVEADPTDINDEDLIADEKVVVLLSGEGYVKRIPLSEYRVQSRGGKGSRGVAKKDNEDAPVEVFEASTKDVLLFFTTQGTVYRRKAYEIPQVSKTARGAHVSNLLSLKQEEDVTNMISMASVPKDGHLVMITKKGYIKRSKVEDYDTARKVAGINAIKLEDDDSVAFVLPTTGSEDVFIITEQGNVIRYSEEVVPVQGRVTRGSRAMKLNDGDRVAQIFTLKPKDKPDIFVITSAGYGKKSPATEYRRLGSRAVKGYAVLKKNALAKRGGKVVGGAALYGGESLLAMTKFGQVIRFGASEIRNTGRTTGGVKVVTLGDGDEVIKLAKIAADAEEE